MIEKIEIIEYLISIGANVNANFGESSLTPLVAAVRSISGNENAFIISKILLDAGADPNGGGYMYYEDVATFYPIIEAVERGDIETTKLLIERGANFDLEHSWEDSIFDVVDRLEDKATASRLRAILIKAGAKPKPSSPFYFYTNN